MFFAQYKGYITQNLRLKREKLCDTQILLTAGNIRSGLNTLKNSFDTNMHSHVLYKITCIGYNSTCVGQCSQYVTTGISEHQNEDPPVGLHLVECCRQAHNLDRDILEG